MDEICAMSKIRVLGVFCVKITKMLIRLVPVNYSMSNTTSFILPLLKTSVL